ncbi:MAG: SRPBCC family protein [Deltaproteobacteria bacterium]|nr:MAG: SRPBCC family protein [Deltaproteobacteria bacterium]
MKVQKSIEIAAPPHKIWPFLIEPEKIQKWCITFLKFEYTGEQRSGVGTTFYLEEKAGGPLMKLNFRITEWVENERVAFSMISGNFVKGYEQSWTVEATPSGSRFTFMEEIKFPYGIVGKIMGLFAKRGSEATVGKMLPKLKSFAEA